MKAFYALSFGMRMSIGFAVTLIVAIILMATIPMQYAAPISAILGVILGIVVRNAESL
ncbi:hypothetical protein [Streptomyces sannanensis]